MRPEWRLAWVVRHRARAAWRTGASGRLEAFSCFGLPVPGTVPILWKQGHQQSATAFGQEFLRLDHNQGLPESAPPHRGIESGIQGCASLLQWFARMLVELVESLECQ